LKGNAAQLHNGAKGGHERDVAEPPVSLGENFETVVFDRFSKNAHDLFLRGVGMGVRGG
jgi:hypothetical protein